MPRSQPGQPETLSLTYELQLILVWSAGSHSPIHDHANAHCVMKILQGRLTETIYGWPCEGVDGPGDCATASDPSHPSTEHTCSNVKMGPQELRVRKETTYARNQVTYMSDRLGLHRVANPDKENVAVSLHLYTVSGFYGNWHMRS